MGDERYFDGPLGEIIAGLEGKERMSFLNDLLEPLLPDEKKILIESRAFDLLTDTEFTDFQMMVSY